MDIYVILEWSDGSQYPSGLAFVDEGRAIAHCKDTNGWLEYVEVTLNTAGDP